MIADAGPFGRCAPVAVVFAAVRIGAGGQQLPHRGEVSPARCCSFLRRRRFTPPIVKEELLGVQPLAAAAELRCASAAARMHWASPVAWTIDSTGVVSSKARLSGRKLNAELVVMS